MHRHARMRARTGVRMACAPAYRPGLSFAKAYISRNFGRLSIPLRRWWVTSGAQPPMQAAMMPRLALARKDSCRTLRTRRDCSAALAPLCRSEEAGGLREAGPAPAEISLWRVFGARRNAQALVFQPPSARGIGHRLLIRPWSRSGTWTHLS